jgi:hypothetical protein
MGGNLLATRPRAARPAGGPQGGRQNGFPPAQTRSRAVRIRSEWAGRARLRGQSRHPTPTVALWTSKTCGWPST